MNDEREKILHNYISLPLAIKVLKHDRKQFLDFKMSNVYLGKLDSSITQLQKDMNEAKKLMYTKYHVDVKQIGSVSYKWESQYDSGTMVYTPDQLKAMTADIVRQYLYGDKAKDFRAKEGW
ncbi:hypothetical protein LG329_19495 (plasmid) [Virgibacillus necropolis]|uniref:hypothetical protein n=1 Tax=Virgibacillus necropolis TaxID=163877 RepID=UPI00384AA138